MTSISLSYWIIKATHCISLRRMILCLSYLVLTIVKTILFSLKLLSSPWPSYSLSLQLSPSVAIVLFCLNLLLSLLFSSSKDLTTFCTTQHQFAFFFNQYPQIDHFTVVCLVAWLLSESEAGVDLVLIETSLLFLCKSLLISMRAAH